MAIKSIRQLEAGMVVASDVETDQGQMILPEGAELTEKLIQTLKTWGVQEVDVEQEDDSPKWDDAVVQKKISECVERLTPRFKNLNLEGSFAASLLRGCAERVAYHELSKQ